MLRDYVVAGLYVYDKEVAEIAECLSESCQGTVGIEDVNHEYFRRGGLRIRRLSHDVVRLDARTEPGLLETAGFVARFEKRWGRKIGCIEEAAFRMGFIDAKRLERLADDLPQGGYREYLERLVRMSSRGQMKGSTKLVPDQPSPAISAVG